MRQEPTDLTTAREKCQLPILRFSLGIQCTCFDLQTAADLQFKRSMKKFISCWPFLVSFCIFANASFSSASGIKVLKNDLPIVPEVQPISIVDKPIQIEEIQFSFPELTQSPDVVSMTFIEAENLWHEIEPLLAKNRFFNNSSPKSSWSASKMSSKIVQLLVPRLKRVFDTLVKNKKIYWIQNPEAISKKIRIASCESNPNCKNLRAFYLPLSGKIFINRFAVKEELARSLFHELFHAFQYSFRFPLDLTVLAEKISPSDMKQEYYFDFLNYYYESQANWQAMRFKMDPRWEHLFAEPKTIGTKVLVPVILYSWAGAIYVLGKAGINLILDSFLPKVDRVLMTGDSSFVLEKYDAALLLNELSIQNQKAIPYVSIWDPEFHYRLARSIEKAYYGELSFLFQSNFPDHRIFNSFHNNYYQRIGLVEIEKDAGCENLISSMLTSSDSPLVFWINLPKEEFAKCPAYKDVGNLLNKLNLANFKVAMLSENPTENISLKALQNVGNVMLNGPLRSKIKTNSPFLFSDPEKDERGSEPIFPRGGEGSTPEIEVLPELMILPQIDVAPVPVEYKPSVPEGARPANPQDDIYVN